MLYLLIEIDPGKVSPYDLMWDKRIIDKISEIGAEYPVKIVKVDLSPASIAASFGTIPEESK